MVYIKNFISCFVIFTFSFGILIFAVSENIKIGLVGGIIASCLYSIRIIISERTVDTYKKGIGKIPSGDVIWTNHSAWK